MDVKFIKVAASKLSTVPVADGQVIVCTDSNNIYYDMNSVRRRASSNGNASNYGLVKLSDNYTSSGGAASSGVAASSKAVSDVYTEVNSMKSTFHSVAFATGNDTVTLPAGSAKKIGSLTIPANCVAVLSFMANNRSVQPDLEFGITLQDAVTDVRWGGMHQKVTQFYSLSDTWMWNNISNNSVNVNLHGKASAATTLQYVTLSALCIPIID